VVPPFYAIRMVMGDLGTFAGLRCDAEARVLDRDQRPIPGLYAAGNDMASVMGGAYPGGGITLGPAMTFGYVAAHSLQRRARGQSGEPAAPDEFQRQLGATRL
jgi:predicted oxidoreductase